MLDLQSVLKYLLEGAAVAVAAFYIPQRKVDLKEIAMISLTAAVVFMVLDVFAPSVAVGARQGAGFGIGRSMVGGADGETASTSSSEESECPPHRKKDKLKDSGSVSSGDSSTETSSVGSDSSAPAPVSASATPTGATKEPFVSQPAMLHY